MARRHARGGVGWILGVMFARDDEAAVGVIVEIGVVFGDEGYDRGADETFSCSVPVMPNSGTLIDIGRVRHGLGDVLHPRSHAIERAVRLDVIEGHAFGIQERP